MVVSEYGHNGEKEGRNWAGEHESWVWEGTTTHNRQFNGDGKGVMDNVRLGGGGE